MIDKIREIHKLIKDKSIPFSEIEKGLDLISHSPEKAIPSLCIRADLPQYVIEWLAIYANSKIDLITIFVNHPNLLNLYSCKNDAYARLILLKRISAYRGLSNYLSNLATIYSKNWK